MNREKAKSIIESLVERYAEHQEDYHRPDYNEQKTRQDFINPFFKALGWDIDNEKGDSEAYREVIYEDKVKVKGKAKAPDYGFRLSGSGNKRLFYLEAKKPAISIRVQKEPAYQLRRYGSSAQVPVSILTNFEDFIIYDCTRVPRVDDSATVARLRHINFKEYVAEFDFIYDTFSHEAVTRGRFDKFIQSGAVKRGTDTLDKRFVQSLDEWRKYLATNIAQHNRKLNDDELNYAVQQTLDRLIFLRFCEDRSVEPYAQMQKVVAKGDAYKGLLHLFTEADAKYNSGLFDFEKDIITPHLKMDPKVVRNVINEMYYPLCNFEFSVMPVEILGNAYEQFLGKVIRILPSRAVKIEEKPEVRKAGGVYYTPQYIVDYIVKNTVGKLIEGKSPKEIEKIKIVDPACGSGSFLLGAFDYLLRYHTDWYHRNGFTAKKGKENPFTPQGTLSTHEKKRILRSCIYGVDLDANAVEVSKLSLLLKCMEGETEASMNQQMSLYHERVLPNLDDNIKDGNSLIDTDFYDSEIDLGYEKKIKPFSWQRAFPEVFKQGGFDAVVGNPPWGADFDEESLSYLRDKNKEIIVRMIDSFMYFIYRSFDLLKTNGQFGMILPDVLFYQTDNGKLREYILDNTNVRFLLNMGDVFEKVVRPSCIIIFSKSAPDKSNSVITLDFAKIKRDIKPTQLNLEGNCESILQTQLKKIPNYLFVTINATNFLILEKIAKSKKIKDLSQFVDEDGIQRGVSPDLKEAFLITSEDAKLHNLEKKYLREVITGGRQVKRFHINYPDLKLIYTRRETDFKSIPNICKYIHQFKSEITCKEVKEGKHSLYALHRAREEKIFTKPEKLVGVITEDEIIVSIDSNKTFVTDGLYLFGVRDIDIKYLMAILNSRLFVFLYRLITMETGRVLAQVKPTILSKMPIRLIDEKNKVEKSKHDEIVKHVDLLLALNEELKEAKLPTRQEQIKQRIAHSEDRINRLVYDLYELTEDEIKIIEE
jgi:type I restriction-modification system DNA methylase subunit